MMPGKTLANTSSKNATLPMHFLVIGGGIAGLSCAIALRRVGHQVTVLEKEPACGSRDHGILRLPPNATKVFYHWGLRDHLFDIGTKSDACSFYTYETGEWLGHHIWKEEFLTETQGDFIFCRRADLCRTLYNTAVTSGVRVILGADVVSINPDACSVTLASGKTARGDLLIGADGARGLSRTLYFQDGEQDVVAKGKIGNFYMDIPNKDILDDPELRFIFREKNPNEPTHPQTVWFGEDHAVVVYPTADTLGVSFFAPCDKPGWWDAPGSHDAMLASLGQCEPRLRKLFSLATTTYPISIHKHAVIEDWIHPSGNLLIIGDAAHPMPPGGFQTNATAIEDAAVLAKLFSHLSHSSQVPSFLEAFMDLRGERAVIASGGEDAQVMYMTLPFGPDRTGRDESYKEKERNGVGVLEPVATPGGDGNEDIWAGMKWVFAYDCEDDADGWWVKWGVLAVKAGAFGKGVLSSGLEGMRVAVEVS